MSGAQSRNRRLSLAICSPYDQPRTCNSRRQQIAALRKAHKGDGIKYNRNKRHRCLYGLIGYKERATKRRFFNGRRRCALTALHSLERVLTPKRHQKSRRRCQSAPCRTSLVLAQVKRAHSLVGTRDLASCLGRFAQKTR